MNTPKQQSGVMLLEAMIAILIFSIGILAIIALQAAAVNASSDAKYRSDACMLANELLGQMRSGNRLAATLQTNYQTGGAAFLAWQTKVIATLPMVAANPPTVNINQLAGPTTTTSVVTVTISWQLPSQANNQDSVHKYTAIAQII